MSSSWSLWPYLPNDCKPWIQARHPTVDERNFRIEELNSRNYQPHLVLPSLCRRPPSSPRSSSSEHVFRFPHPLHNSQGNAESHYMASRNGSLSPRLEEGFKSEMYSRKVFIGGLPPDIDQGEIVAEFNRFGGCWVDWPHKLQNPNTRFPPKGYAFVIFDDEVSVGHLMEACRHTDGKYFYTVSSSSVRGKTVQVRPWLLSDAEHVCDNGGGHLDERKTVFVGGVPRTVSAYQLSVLFENRFGSVVHAGIDTDNELKYPKGAARVTFSTHESFVAAIACRLILISSADDLARKRVEIKPFVLDDQGCDSCSAKGLFFCPNIICLQYYCQMCWASAHCVKGRECHKPLLKEAGAQPAVLPYRLTSQNLWDMKPRNPYLKLKKRYSRIPSPITYAAHDQSDYADRIWRF